ncbi:MULTISPECIES: MFS transporter [unclassified Vibrio]|uniref:MFS transporter n=1 Tax=unclassified Vibrio TaxID=2614977 RepID=UPI00136109A1|nr:MULTISPECIES: MFS transporter [unclassified Vibrio]NAW56026.1 MFS transporter [Vibrio sp. V36_P2S2PM302]NAX20618.1 MFS transporter [Vibrio sp. V39_P1S14PM300]NAX26606.1 MFS transporter [Vibrio sp. V38_P2S17PM301]NAX29506.1 MFS transporter [Vibrio sp. V37_P2S8PM304]
MKDKTLPYLCGRFFDGISSGLFMMALPWIMLKQPNMGAFVALTALACTAVSFVLTPFFSTLTDRHSRKNLLIMVQIIQSSTAFTVLVAYWFDAGSIWLLAAAQLLFWVSSNMAWNANNAFTQENYAKHEYARISGYQEIVLQGTTLGAGAIGVILLEMWGVVEFALFAAVASTISAISYVLTPYHRQLRESTKTPFMAQLAESKMIFRRQPTFYAFLLVSCLSYPVLTYLGKLVPIWFAEQNVSGSWVAGYNIAFGLGSLMTGLLVSRILTLFPHQKIMQYSMVILGVLLLAMSGFMQPVYIIMLTLGFGFFNALNRIARTNWMHHTISIQQRGRVDGGLAMFATSVQSLSYILIAFLADVGATDLGFVIIGAIVLTASLYMLLIGHRLEKQLHLIPA